MNPDPVWVLAVGAALVLAVIVWACWGTANDASKGDDR